MLLLEPFQYFSKHSCVIAEKFCSKRLVCVDVVHAYSSFDTTAAWSKLCHFLSMMFGSDTADRLSITVNGFASRVLMSFSVDETLLLR